MTPRDPAAIRARHRPGAITLIWLWRAVAAWLAAGPLAAALMGGGVGSLPGGDAALFEPGGVVLIEAVRTSARALRAALHQSAWTFVVMGVLGLVPLALLLVALSDEGKLRPAAWTGRALEHVPGLILVAGLAVLLQGLVLLLATLAAWAAHSLASERMDVRAADLVTLGVAALGAVGVLLVGIYADLARATLVRHRSRARDAMRIAAGLFRRRALTALSGWLVPALWSVAAVIGAAMAVGALHVERGQAWRLASVVLVHQAVAVTLVALRAIWLAQALRLAASVPVDDAGAAQAAVAPSV